MGRVELVLDPLRGERVAVELPLAFRTDPAAARRDLGLAEWVDVSDPLVARAVVLLRAARAAAPTVPLAILGGVAHRLRCPSSNAAGTGLRRSLHDLDVACLHKGIRGVRAFLDSLDQREGSAMRVLETQGDRIFNASGEGRRLRFHLLLGGDATGVALGTLDLLADEFRFCHRFDLRDDVVGSADQLGTVPLADLLLAKLQFIQRIPVADRSKVTERVLVEFGRHDVLIGPEAKDVRDILAVLVDHPLDETAEGISPRRFERVLGSDWGWWRTVSLNLQMVGRSSVLASLAPELRSRATERLDELVRLAGGITPPRRRALFGGPWWEEVDAVPSVDGRATVG